MNTKILKNLFKIISIFIISINLNARDYTWHCKGDISSSTLYGWLSSNNPTAVYGFENMPDSYPELYGEMDTVNGTFVYWDDTSPVCGGDSNENKLLEAYCNDRNQNSCWDVLIGSSNNPLIESSDEGYTNSVIFVNNFPCLARNVTNFTFGAYEWDNNTDIGLANANLNTIFDESIEIVSDSVASEQRAICNTPDPDTSKDYTAQLNQIIDNTALNNNAVSKLTNIDNRQEKQDEDLNSFINSVSIDNILNIDTEINSFNNTFETTIFDTYSSYSDVFGFGGYGVAPEAISFTMFTKEYKIFDPEVLTPHIDLIRNTFVIFAYLWGFIITFRST